MLTEFHRHRSAPAVVLTPLVLVMCIGLAACGDSSSSSKGRIISGGITAASGGPVLRTATSVDAARTKPNQRLAQFTACLRRNGINAHSTTTIDARSAQYMAARAKCSGVLHRAIFRPLKAP